MAHQFITVETARGVLTVTFNRPDVLNSFHTPMARELQAVLAAAAADPDVRAVLLTGGGRAFCAGQDLEEVRPAENGDDRDFEAHVQHTWNPVVRTIRQMEKPVLAAVNGAAAGAGANLALACDLVLASSTASFLQAFIRIGLVPDTGGTFFLPRLVGWARAAAWMMLGERVTAQQAFEAGMIYRVVEPEHLLQEATALAIQLATQPTYGIGLTKRLLNASIGNGLDAQLDLEAELQGAAGRSADYAEGVAAFLAKRAPVFSGH
jgi:2-(1,2-epoxy-1,2-dihydrophenyl)acetyl-CoA isomerase